MDPASFALFLLSAFVAEVIGTMAGFGAATILTPIASFFFDIKTAVALVACFHLLGNASRLSFFGRHVQWPVIRRFGLIGVLASFAGAQASAWLSASMMRLCLGVFLIAYAGLEAARITELRVPPTTRTLLIGGVLSGFIAGLIGTGGAIRSVCLLGFGLIKDAYIGTSALIALVVDATRLPVYLAQHFLPAVLMPVLAGFVPVAFAGSWVGQRLVRRVSPATFRHIVLVLLFLMGCKLVLDGWR